MQARVLSIQSHAVHGYVGQKACTFPLQLLGVEVDPLNSVQLSNHKGYSNGARGQVLGGEEMLDIIDGLDANALLEKYTHVLTGYIGTVSFLRAVLATVRRLRAKTPGVIFFLDPVLGDHGRFYAPKELVPVYRDEALALATVITPNQFEMEQLAGMEITNEASAWDACAFAHERGVKTVIITSCLPTAHSVWLLASTKTLQKSTPFQRYAVEIPLIPGRFGGTGDLMAGLLLAWTSKYKDEEGDGGLLRALEQSCATLQAVLLRTADSNDSGGELKLIQSQEDIKTPPVARFNLNCKALYLAVAAAGNTAV